MTWRVAPWLLGFLTLVALLARLPAAAHWGPDYIQFWSASRILVSGGNPYDPEAQARENAAQGWDLERDGLGRYRFLPYYYPPWLALALSPLVVCGFAGAKLAWLAILVEAVVASAYLLRRRIADLHPAWAMALALAFGVWWTTLPIGQVAPLMVLAWVAVWRLADAGRDRAAGWALAALSIKPHLAMIATVGVLVWAIRRRRWHIVEGWATCLAILVVASTLIFPGWLPAMLAAPVQTPLVTVEKPWLGASWLSLLRSIGLEGWPLALAYAAAAAPAVVVMLRSAWSRQTEVYTLLALAALAAFFIVPYLRYYDLPILLVPLFELLRRPLAGQRRALLVLAALIVPAALWIVTPGEPSPLMSQVHWAWLAFGLAAVWIEVEGRNSPRRHGGHGAAKKNEKEAGMAAGFC
jgi:glycosyl transferase family 87